MPAMSPNSPKRPCFEFKTGGRNYIEHDTLGHGEEEQVDSNLRRRDLVTYSGGGGWKGALFAVISVKGKPID